jgi:hypothetical protein
MTPTCAKAFWGGKMEFLNAFVALSNFVLIPAIA